MTDAGPPADGGTGLRVDVAQPTVLPRRRRERTPRVRPTGTLWGGPGRTALKAGSWVLAVALVVPVLLPLLREPERGADSPSAAVTRLLQGLADLDGVAILAAVDPAETGDPVRAETAYTRLADRLVREGEVPPSAVTDVLGDAEGQVGGGTSRAVLAALAGVDLDLTGLSLRERGPTAGGSVPVQVRDGSLTTSVGDAGYVMPLAEGWRVGRRPIDPVLVTVERDGRWFVSLGATADVLLGRE